MRSNYTCHAIAGIEHHFERSDSGGGNKTEDEISESVEHRSSALGWFSRMDWDKCIAEYQITDLLHAASLTDGYRVFPYHLEPIVLLRIVGGGHHDPTVCLEMVYGEVEKVGRGKGNLDYRG